MVNFEQYPHFLYKRTAALAYTDSNGSWVEGTAAWVFVGKCRNESNGKGNSVTLADGRALLFSSLVQMPVGTPRINEGTEIAVTNTQLTAEELASFEDSVEGWKASGKLQEKGQVAKFDTGRLHCRAWI